MTHRAKKIRIAHLLIHPAPYYEPVIKALLGQDEFDWDLSSVFTCDYGHAGTFSNESKCVIASDIKTLNPNFLSGLKIAWRLMRKFSFSKKYDLVMWPSYAPWWMTLPVLMRLMVRGAYSLALDTTHDAGGEVSKFFKCLFFRNAKFLWVPGEASKRFLVDAYKIDERKIVKGLYIPTFSESLRNDENDEPIFLMVANDRPFRRMDIVKEGFQKYRQNGGVGRLVLCGNGVSRFASAHIETIEGVPNSELSKLYARCDVYIHNGNEQFSTALLIGAMARKPLIASVDIGVWADLFKSGNLPGVSVEKWDSLDAWCQAFEQMLSMRGKWSSMGEIAFEYAALFVPERISDEIISKIKESF
jgi:glycosyltransferase involved in cell wall biosynthesis